MTVTVRVCREHRDRATPLISTFAFHGAEYWCPWCGALEEMFNGCPEVEGSEELRMRAIEDLKRAKDYLTARTSLICDRLAYAGRWISPRDLPPDVIAQYRETLAAWRYPAEIAAAGAK